MISSRAKTGFDRMLTQSIEESLRSESHPTWAINPMTGTQEIKALQYILLTLSSYDFRVLVLLHFSPDSASMKYVADRLKLNPAELEKTRFNDYLSETGNIFCGVVKRELFQFYSHLGMSTPNRLGRESLTHIQTLSIDHEVHVKAEGSDGITFYGSLYVSAFGDLDFDMTQKAKQDEVAETGELEMF